MHACSLDKHSPRECLGHVGIVEFGEAKWRLAQFAVLLVRVRKPLHETFLMHEFDTAVAFARIEQRFIRRPFTSTNATCLPSTFTAGLG